MLGELWSHGVVAWRILSVQNLPSVSVDHWSTFEVGGGSVFMKAVVFHQHGGPEVLQYEEVAEPVAGGGVNAAAVQIAKLTGARVLVVGSNEQNWPWPRSWARRCSLTAAGRSDYATVMGFSPAAGARTGRKRSTS